MQLQPDVEDLRASTPSGPARRSATAPPPQNRAAARRAARTRPASAPWGPDAHPARRSRASARRSRAGASSYFKFDFLVWLDCAGQGDLYEHREAFVAMLDRLRRRPPRGHVPDRRDQRLPAVPVRVGHARAVVVPERLAAARPAAAQPLEPEPVRAGVLARPARARRARLRSDHPVDDADGGGAAVAHHLLQRPARAARRGGRRRPALDRRSTARTATCSTAWSTRCSPTRSRRAGPRCSVGPERGRGRAAGLPPGLAASRRGGSRCATCRPAGASGCCARPTASRRARSPPSSSRGNRGRGARAPRRRPSSWWCRGEARAGMRRGARARDRARGGGQAEAAVGGRRPARAHHLLARLLRRARRRQHRPGGGVHARALGGEPVRGRALPRAGLHGDHRPQRRALAVRPRVRRRGRSASRRTRTRSTGTRRCSAPPGCTTTGTSPPRRFSAWRTSCAATAASSR